MNTGTLTGTVVDHCVIDVGHQNLGGSAIPLSLASDTADKTRTVVMEVRLPDTDGWLPASEVADK